MMRQTQICPCLFQDRGRPFLHMDCTPADAAAGRNDCQKDLPTLGKPGQTEPPVDVSVIVSSPLHAGDAQDPSPTEHTSHPSPENVRTTYGNCSSSDKTDVGGDTQSIPVRSQDGRSAELLETIPWEDVLFRYVLTCLPLTDLFRLRATCRLAHECVSQFFTCCRYVNTNRYNNTWVHLLPSCVKNNVRFCRKLSICAQFALFVFAA